LNQVSLALDAEVRSMVRDKLGSLTKRERHVGLEVGHIS